ncbi:MAG: hypothetical protein NT031_09650, partial [Planctomycetota bacterium]|nr:hypothetical protein [Planctomycetota bacterium]
LAKLLPYHKGDLVGIFNALKGFPATIRFLDPPLHEFVPHDEKAPKAKKPVKKAAPAKKPAKKAKK